jgi:hypothetical protein
MYLKCFWWPGSTARSRQPRHLKTFLDPQVVKLALLEGWRENRKPESWAALLAGGRGYKGWDEGAVIPVIPKSYILGRGHLGSYQGPAFPRASAVVVRVIACRMDG